jgi:regulator of replication initiation timing
MSEDKLIQVLLFEIRNLQKEIKQVSAEVVSLRIENQELKAELHALKNFFMPENKSNLKLYTLIVTTVGGAMAGLIAVINNMVAHK